MRQHLQSARSLPDLRFALGLACILIGLVAAHAQVIINPSSISGTVAFGNTNPAILSLLNPPFGEGISSVYFKADSLPPAPPITTTSPNYLPVSSALSNPYSLTVDAETPGIQYAVEVYAQMLGTKESYFFKSQTSAPVSLGQPPVTLDFSECVGVVTVQFVDLNGQPIVISGGQIDATSTTTLGYSGITTLTPGTTEQRIYLGGGDTHSLNMTVYRGTDLYSDRISTVLTTNVPVTCDAFTTVSMVIPDAGTLGTIKGTFSVAGEFPLNVPSDLANDQPGFTSVVAQDGPFGNRRFAGFRGTNFTAPSAGSFILENLPPTGEDLTSSGYEVAVRAVFGTNRNISLLYTPALGAGKNPPVEVAAGQTVDLGNVFALQPGYLAGALRFSGPPELPGDASGFRSIIHAGDQDGTNAYPDALSTYGLYWTSIIAYGLDTPILGALYTASGGVGVSDFDGVVDPATGTFNGAYKMVLAGLNGESSVWNRQYLELTFSTQNANATNTQFYSSALQIEDKMPAAVQIDPGQTIGSDLNYCFSEVTVVFHDSGGSFYDPNLTGPGSFAGLDFLGNNVNYGVNLSYAYGSPINADTATNVGQVTVFLPQGTYTLKPSVAAADGSGIVGLQPITLTVGCAQRIALETCLQLNLDAPACTRTNLVPVTGSVRSCGNAVTSIAYTLNDGPSITVCTDCGPDPAYAFTLDLTGADTCSVNTLKVDATDALGGVSSVTTQIVFDSTPPTIHCPSDLVLSASDTNGAIANFQVTATDNCAGPVTLTISPPSGSVFPVGTTVVNCVATDACGNVSQCTFQVIVTPQGTPCTLTIAMAVQVIWPCSGVLQSGPTPTGPWTDLPGASNPYYTPVGTEPTFFRVRN